MQRRSLTRRRLGDARRRLRHLGRRATAGQRPLPDFLILGAQKAGTSSLFAYLTEHPGIAGGVTKEIHYFDFHYEAGLANYRACFPRARPSRIYGEASPYYLVHPRVPGRVKEDLPFARLIVLLRNPIDRAISHYNHERARGHEALTLEAALDAEEGRLAGELERLVEDPHHQSYSHVHHSYVERGKYAVQLHRWFEHFDRSRFLIVQSERLFAQPAAVLAEVQAFLDVSVAIPPGLVPHNAQEYPPITKALRTRLSRDFEPENQRLYDLLGVTYSWD